MKNAKIDCLINSLFIKKISIRILFLFWVLTAWCPPVIAQENFSIIYTFDSVVAKTGGYIDPTPVPEVEGLLFAPFQAVPNDSIGGMSGNPNAGGRFSFTGWPLAVVDNQPSSGSIDLNQYYEFSLSVLPGYSLQINEISVSVGRTGTGIRRCAVRSSQDQFTENIAFVCDTQDDKIIVLDDLSLELKDVNQAVLGTIYSTTSIDITGPDSLVCRFYGWSAKQKGGTFSIDDVAIQGSVLKHNPDQTLPDTILPDIMLPDTMLAGSSYAFPAEAYDEVILRFMLSAERDSLPSMFFKQDVTMQRTCFDAALNMYNMQEASAMEQLQLEIEIQDTLGNDCNSFFDLNMYLPDSVGSKSNNMALLRIFPSPLLPSDQLGPYLLGGHFSYLDKLSGETRTNLLYPMRIYPDALPDCRVDYFLPLNADPLWQFKDSAGSLGSVVPLGMMIRNQGSGVAARLSLTHPRTEQPGNSLSLWAWEANNQLRPLAGDSILIDSLLPGEARSFLWCFTGAESLVVEDLLFNSLHEDPFKHPDSAMLQLSGLFPLYRLVEAYNELNDQQADFLIKSHRDSEGPDSLILSQGLSFPVFQADSLHFLNHARNTDSLHLSLFPSAPGWNYFKAKHPDLNAQAEVLSVKRLEDAQHLPAQNVWLSSENSPELPDSIRGNYVHILDQTPAAAVLTYEVVLSQIAPEFVIDSLYITLCEGEDYYFGGQLISEAGSYLDTIYADTAPDTLKILNLTILEKDYISLNDSVCIGKSYALNGFNLEPHTVAGTYLYSDTLLNQWGCDSIVNLNLEVCAPPETPGPIYGDSLVVVAGYYTYTIAPVPNAGFYIWTVLPPYWEKNIQGHSLSLNIPYMGSGSISVKAVNCCGESADSSLDINAPMGIEQTGSTSSFNLFPDPSKSGFVLETSGIEGETSICISSMSGQILHRQTKQISAEDKRFEFSLEAYTQGMYIISIVNERVSGVEKIIRE